MSFGQLWISLKVRAKKAFILALMIFGSGMTLAMAQSMEERTIKALPLNKAIAICYPNSIGGGMASLCNWATVVWETLPGQATFINSHEYNKKFYGTYVTEDGFALPALIVNRDLDVHPIDEKKAKDHPSRQTEGERL